MTTIPQPQSVRWRALSADELAAGPETKLGGALAVIFWSAVAMVAVVVLTVAGAIVFGSFFTFAMMSRSIFSGSSIASRIGGIALIPQVMFAVWAFVFAIMTMGRRPSTPKVSSVLIVIWAAASISAQIATRYIIAQSNFDLVSQASLLPYVFLEIALVAAFCGYMSDGRRPNAYFRKRVRA